jgi:hypothetical protein
VVFWFEDTNIDSGVRGKKNVIPNRSLTGRKSGSGQICCFISRKDAKIRKGAGKNFLIKDSFATFDLKLCDFARNQD